MKTESAIIIGLKIPPVPQAFCDFISQIGGQKFREVSDLTKVTQRLSGSTGDSSPGQRASQGPTLCRCILLELSPRHRQIRACIRIPGAHQSTDAWTSAPECVTQ